MLRLPPVQETLEEVLDRLSVSYDRIVLEKSLIPGHVTYHVHCAADESLLIGRDGQNLRALSHLVRLLLEEREKKIPEDFVIDVGGYQSRRIRNLVDYVEQEVKTFLTLDADKHELKPLSAFQRRVVHAVVSDQPNPITTRSEGDGFERRLYLMK